MNTLTGSRRSGAAELALASVVGVANSGVREVNVIGLSENLEENLTDRILGLRVILVNAVFYCALTRRWLRSKSE